MLEAAFWGLVGGLALVVGAVLGIFLSASARLIALVMGFGAGVLISALAFELAAESFRAGGTDATVIGLAAGALTFYVGDRILDKRGAEHREDATGAVVGDRAGYDEARPRLDDPGQRLEVGRLAGVVELGDQRLAELLEQVGETEPPADLRVCVGEAGQLGEGGHASSHSGASRSSCPRPSMSMSRSRTRSERPYRISSLAVSR